MAVTYSLNCNFEKPTPGDSLNVWGAELNRSIDFFDSAMLSNNFAEDESTHSGLNFGFKNGRTMNETTLYNVSASTVLLTDNDTNYIEVSTLGIVSANTTGFTQGKISLFVVTTISGGISTVVDKRCYLDVPISQFFSSDGTTISTNQELNNSTLKTDDGNLLINAASKETNADGTITIKSGTTNPTTRTASQLTIFPTTGANSTIGLNVEKSVDNDVLPINVNTVTKYWHMRETALNPLSGFMLAEIDVVNTTDETTIMTVTIPGRASPGGQFLFASFLGHIDTATASHQNTVKFYCGSDTTQIYSSTSATLNKNNFMTFKLFIKNTTDYTMGTRGAFGNYTWTGVTDATEDFTTDTIIKITSQWNVADAGASCKFYSGVFEVKN